MKILLFGGSGTLGKELMKINPDIIAPTHDEVDVADINQVYGFLNQHNPDIIINAAAITDNRMVESDANEAIDVNIIGSANLVRACERMNVRMVYISTDYVYKGDRGNYKETDEILPFNLYAWTKLGGECSARCIKNHLIIRTSFGKNEFNYPEAFVDKYASKDYVEKIAPLIYEAALSPLVGIVNIGTERKTIYEYAKEKNKDVLPVKIEDSPFITPKDTSLNLQKWIDYKSEKSSVFIRCALIRGGGLTVRYSWKAPGGGIDWTKLEKVLKGAGIAALAGALTW